MKRPVNIWKVLALLLGVLAIAGGIAWIKCAYLIPRLAPPANAIMVMSPYRHAGTWVFDDASVGLSKEPFVAGIPEMIDEMVADIPDAEDGFRLLFSTQPFPDHTHTLVWRRGDRTGNWYYCEELGKEGWLCPALFAYYDEAPKTIYVKAEAE